MIQYQFVLHCLELKNSFEGERWPWVAGINERRVLKAVPQFMKVAALAALFITWEVLENGRHPYYRLYVCGMTAFSLLRIMAIPWRSFITGMSKVFGTVYGAVRSAGSRV